MSFLQPLLLAALPLAALPIVIHLVNQYRYQSVRWGAMMFLLAAQRMSRGYTKIRQWLILAFRTLAVLGLILAISRPLSSGWLGLAAGGRADTTLILLDRSPSMQQQTAGGGSSKLDTARRQLAETLRTLGSSRWVLIDGLEEVPRELADPDELLTLPQADGISAAADIPAMLDAARSYLEVNPAGRTDIWICSDLRENDWQSGSSRWEALRDAFQKFGPLVRFHLLAYAEPAAENVAVRVTQARRQGTVGDTEGELRLSVRLLGSPDGDAPRESEAAAGDASGASGRFTLPIEFEIAGVRSVHTVEWNGVQFDLQDHRLPLAPGQERGWGRVSIPADANPADNEYYFVFGPPVTRRTVLVAEDPAAMRPLELAAAIPSDPGAEYQVDVIPSDQLRTVPWEEVSLLIWQGALPEGETGELIEQFLSRGGHVLFFPPERVADSEFLGVRWKSVPTDDTPRAVATWRGDQDLLAQTLSGAALPIGEIQVRQHVELSGEFTTLATLAGNRPLLVRAITDRGAAYFWATTPSPSHSSLARDGVVLYVSLQRAIAGGAEALGDTRHLPAGPSEELTTRSWRKLAGGEGGLSTDYLLHAGVYADETRLWAINRTESEDRATIVPPEEVLELFAGLDIRRVDEQAGSLASLVQEVWRFFLVTMLAALVTEAALSLPRRRAAAGGTP
jgi:hypothetical protein